MKTSVKAFKIIKNRIRNSINLKKSLLSNKKIKTPVKTLKIQSLE